MDRIDTITVPRPPAAGRPGRRTEGVRRDLHPPAPQGPADRLAARPGAVRDRLRLWRPRQRGVRHVRRGPRPAPRRRTRPRPRQGRQVLLDDCGYVALLRLYLARAAFTSGPLFRASINGSGGPLSYDAAHHRWTNYCQQAGVDIDIHQLRHAHATELINAGVSVEAVRRRLGHASTETTQIYTLLADKVADDEIRAARRCRDTRR